MGIMESALRRITAAPITGPATSAVPTGSTGVGLDAFAAARSQARAKLAALQVNQTAALQQLGEHAYTTAVDAATREAQQAEAAYVRAAKASGVGIFVD